MKLIVLFLLLVSCMGCSSRELPKVGECYKVSQGHGEYQFRRIVSIDLKVEYGEIGYVYNYPDHPNFEKNEWYTITGFSFVPMSLNDFYRNQDDGLINKIECPF